MGVQASKQYEQEQYSKSQPRRYPALSVWSNSNSPSTSPPVTDTAISNKSLSSSAPTNPTPLLSVVTSSSEESTHDSKAGSNTGTNDIKTSATPSSFNMDHIVKKFMPSAQASSGGGGGYFSISSGSKKATATEASVSSKTSLSSSTDRPKAGSTDEGGADESDGWNRIEQEFQRSLMKAASNAERKRDFKKPGSSLPSETEGYEKTSIESDGIIWLVMTWQVPRMVTTIPVLVLVVPRVTSWASVRVLTYPSTLSRTPPTKATLST